jgi:hypothetical protein
MASDGYWKGQFLAGVTETLAVEILSKDLYIEQFLQSKGTDWLANMTTGERKEQWAAPVVIHMRLVHDTVDKLAKGDGMLDHVISEGLHVQTVSKDPRFDENIGRYLDSDEKAEFPRLWSYSLQNRLNDMVGSALIRCKWWQDNYKAIVSVRRKVAMVGGIMTT